MNSEKNIIEYAIHQKYFDYIELAHLLNYNKIDTMYIKMFWNCVNKNEWIFLSKNMITEWFGIKNGKNTLLKYERILYNNCKPDKEFRKTNFNNKIVKKWINFNKELYGIHIDENDYNRKYYIISPNAFKILLEKLNVKIKRLTNVYNNIEYMSILMSKIKTSKKERSVLYIILKKLNLL